MAVNTVPAKLRSIAVEEYDQMIDLDRRIVEVYRGPNSAGYNEKHTLAAGDQLAPQALPDLSLAVAEILGVDA